MIVSHLRSRNSVGTNSSAEVNTAALGLAGSLLKVLPELVGAVDLEAVAEMRVRNANEVRDRLVQERSNRHAHHPDPEAHERDVFMLGEFCVGVSIPRRICCEAAGNSRPRGQDEVFDTRLIKKSTR